MKNAEQERKIQFLKLLNFLKMLLSCRKTMNWIKCF